MTACILITSAAIWGGGNLLAYYIQAKSFGPTTALSLSIVAAISAERYFGVLHPLIHRTKIIKVKLSHFLLFIWLSCAIVSVPAYFHEDPFQVSATLSIVFLILITICSYIKIAYTVILSKIRRERLTNDHPNPEGQRSQKARKNRKEIMYFLKELKMAKSSFLIVLCYLLCYTPVLVVFAVLRTKISPLTKFYARSWCLLFVMLNSSLNRPLKCLRHASVKQ